jgi:hypothetical protein
MNAELLQLMISLAGIAAMTGICRLLFGAGDMKLPDAETLAASMARDIPGFRAVRCARSRDGKSALVEDSGGAVHLAVMRGDGLVTRKLGRGISLARDGDRLALMLKDFTLGKVALELDDAPAWEAKLR